LIKVKTVWKEQGR